MAKRAVGPGCKTTTILALIYIIGSIPLADATNWVTGESEFIFVTLNESTPPLCYGADGIHSGRGDFDKVFGRTPLVVHQSTRMVSGENKSSLLDLTADSSICESLGQWENDS